MGQPAALSAKARVEKEVLHTIIDGLNSGTMSVEQARQAAKETLATVGKIEEHEDSILAFYKNLSEKYKVFEILYTKVKAEIIKSREISDYKKALSAIDAGDLESAHQIANAALVTTAHETENVQ